MRCKFRFWLQEERGDAGTVMMVVLFLVILALVVLGFLFLPPLPHAG